jgi:hypothetical protein
MRRYGNNVPEPLTGRVCTPYRGACAMALAAVGDFFWTPFVPHGSAEACSLRPA